MTKESELGSNSSPTVHPSNDRQHSETVLLLLLQQRLSLQQQQQQCSPKLSSPEPSSHLILGRCHFISLLYSTLERSSSEKSSEKRSSSSKVCLSV